MLFFRSEEHLSRWLAARDGKRGAVLSLADTWRLAKAWYPDRRDRHWRPRTVDESQAVLDGLGLDRSFWSLR